MCADIIASVAVKRADDLDMRHICNRCLRLWHLRRNEQRSACPRCGGALRPH
jgi:rRNA maturation endonuclease Nob1